MEIGLFTPPFGVNIFVAQASFNMTLRDIYVGILPFFGVNLMAAAALGRTDTMRGFGIGIAQRIAAK